MGTRCWARDWGLEMHWDLSEGLRPREMRGTDLQNHGDRSAEGHWVAGDLQDWDEGVETGSAEAASSSGLSAGFTWH